MPEIVTIPEVKENLPSEIQQEIADGKLSMPYEDAISDDTHFNFALQQQTINKLKENLNQSHSTHTLRMFVVIALFILVIVFLTYTCRTFTCIGHGCLKYSPSIIIAFIVQTTATVLGLFAMALGWLFPRNTQ